MKAGRRQGRQRKRWEDSIREWTVVRSCLTFIRSGQNHLARHGEREKMTKQTEEKIGRQHQRNDRPRVCQVPQGSKEQWRRLIVRSSVVSKRPSQLRDRWRWWCMCVCCCVRVRVRVCVCVCTWNGNSYICSEQSVDSWKAVSNRLWINSINSDVHGQKQTKKSEATAQDSHLPFTSTFIFPYKPNVYFPIQTKFPFITKKQQM